MRRILRALAAVATVGAVVLALAGTSSAQPPDGNRGRGQGAADSYMSLQVVATVHPNQSVTVNGFGCRAGSTVDWTVRRGAPPGDGPVIASGSTTADATGYFTFTTPQLPDGQMTSLVTCGGRSAEFGVNASSPNANFNPPQNAAVASSSASGGTGAGGSDTRVLSASAAASGASGAAAGSTGAAAGGGSAASPAERATVVRAADSSTIELAGAAPAVGSLPRTGSDSEIPVARLGVILVACGGIALYAGRRRTARRAQFTVGV